MTPFKSCGSWCRPFPRFRIFRRYYSHSVSEKNYDVIVVGGGHAGTEACSAAARMGARTLLVTHKKETVGEMSCNPSFGGIGKGHLMREVDALGGVCARICDLSGINYRVLNRVKGPAVWGPRAQIDRELYKFHLQKELFENTENLEIMVASVEDLILDYSTRSCLGIITRNGDKILGKSVIITTGTFLNGQINIGLKKRPAGRIGDEPAIGLANTLKNLNFRMGRLKTGTPPRLNKNTIDFSVCEIQLPDKIPLPFSFMNDSVWIKPEDQIPCYLTRTNKEVGEIMLKNLHLNCHVKEEVTGPRYCPSIESKVLRFGNISHQIWLEPEGLNSNVIYPGGFSCTLPEELQVEAVRKMKGLEKVEVLRHGYGVEYDFVDPRELNPTLETVRVKNLFFAGQINGTTGYEEAAAQGIIAGINAACKCQDKPEFVVNRTEAYIGVLIDDLTTQGTNEPYRMFTSRAEFRLALRPDNADTRLTARGFQVGCVTQERMDRTKKTIENLQAGLALFKSVTKSTHAWRRLLAWPPTKTPVKKSAFEMLSAYYYDLSVEKLCEVEPDLNRPFLFEPGLAERLKIETMYESAVSEEMVDVMEVRRDEALKIPSDMDYSNHTLNLSIEEREKLMITQPQTIAAASRIPGVTPNAVLRLLRFVKKSTTKNQLSHSL